MQTILSYGMGVESSAIMRNMNFNHDDDKTPARADGVKRQQPTRGGSCRTNEVALLQD